jgi:hypothetical protein
MLRPVVSAAMVETLISSGEDLPGTFDIGLVAALVGPLGLFRVVVQRPFQAIYQAIVDMQAHIAEAGFDLFQGDIHNMIAYLKQGGLDRIEVVDAINIGEQQGCRARLMGIRMEFHEIDLSVFYEFLL